MRFLSAKNPRFPNWNRLFINALLFIEDQDDPDFHVNEVTTKYDLLTFTFVRHPFERWAKENCMTCDRDLFS